MAKEEKPAAAAPAAPQGGGKKLLIIIIVVLLFVILAIGGVAAFFLLTRHNNNAAAIEEEEEMVVIEAAKKSHPVYVTMETFTVNLVPESGEQFVQVVFSVEVVGVEFEERIKTFMPKIRNNVVLLLSSKKASELLTKEGKEKLAGEIRDQMNLVLAPGTGSNGPVKEVLFTSFIIQ
ncbi:MAG: flagellar basal body-associated FliL family protein [Candidatus Accumulibacter sp.]|jgi:flagellar FliL protein|nr:flagellar basal body-associated FliL family protein [Accumulibacter sp.]